jgi:hypothetical protein
MKVITLIVCTANESITEFCMKTEHDSLSCITKGMEKYPQYNSLGQSAASVARKLSFSGNIPGGGDGRSSRNVGFFPPLEAADGPRGFY